MNRKVKNKPVFKVIFFDILMICLGLIIFAIFHHVIPQKINSDAMIINDVESNEVSIEIKEDDSLENADINYSDKFTQGEIVKTDNSYKSSDVSISIDKVYENNVTYYVADIYLKDYTDILTAFAKDEYGKAFVADTLDMAIENEAILAISGDYYGNGDDGLVIRNGVLYRDEVANDVLVMYKDGSMATYKEDEFDIDIVISEGAYQGWEFGPMLLDDGEVIEAFDASRHILKDNPRCALGYYEPGHYLFIVVDGRQEGYSEGVTLEELSEIFYNLGCTVAYNLDGGKSAVMVFMDEVVNQPASGGRDISDIVYITQ